MATYELIIKNESSQRVASQVGGAGGINTENQNQESVSVGGETTSENTGAQKLLKQVFGYKAVKSFATQALGHRVSTVQLRTGSHEAQQRANFSYQIGQQALGIAETIAIGAATGGLAGAAVGLVLGLVHTAIDWNNKADTLRLQNQLEQNAQLAAAQRATYSGSRYQTVLDE